MSEADQAMLVMPVGPRDAPDDILASVRALSGASRGLSLVVVAGYHIDAILWASLRDLPAIPVPLRVFPQAGPVT